MRNERETRKENVNKRKSKIEIKKGGTNIGERIKKEKITQNMKYLEGKQKNNKYTRMRRTKNR